MMMMMSTAADDDYDEHKEKEMAAEAMTTTIWFDEEKRKSLAARGCEILEEENELQTGVANPSFLVCCGADKSISKRLDGELVEGIRYKSIKANGSLSQLLLDLFQS